MTAIGLPCPECLTRGMKRAAELEYRCRDPKCDRQYHLRELLPWLMEGPLSTGRTDAPPIPEPPTEGQPCAAPRLTLIETKELTR